MCKLSSIVNDNFIVSSSDYLKRAWICVYQLLQKLVTWFMRTWSLLFVEEGRIGTCHAIHVVTRTILGIQLVLVFWFSHAKNLKQGFMLTLFSLFDLIWGYCAQVKCGTIWGDLFFLVKSFWGYLFFFVPKFWGYLKESRVMTAEPAGGSVGYQMDWRNGPIYYHGHATGFTT